jgi:hypothetical protein
MGWDEIRLFLLLKFSAHRYDVRAILSGLNAYMGKENQQEPSASDRELVQQIRRKTSDRNRNNLSRTEAYLEFYHHHPEVHWALLAHCVSRNGGYGITDLKSEYFLRIASEEMSTHFFAFLERTNWLIFHDAYAQLLLYKESRIQSRNLFHLLPALSVSSFMAYIWNHFWHTHDSHLLTHALIINEQNYIEARVVKNQGYQSTVESSILFRMQSFLNLNQILIPYYEGPRVRLAGTTMLHFTSVEDRIRTGLRLYDLLFKNHARHQAILRFLDNVPHSGSRADYWPNVFTLTRANTMPALQHSQLPAKTTETDIKSSNRIYSPKLSDVWPDVMHGYAEPGDWFTNLKHVIYLFEKLRIQSFDITDKYLQSIKTTESFVMAKEKVGNLLPD